MDRHRGDTGGAGRTRDLHQRQQQWRPRQSTAPDSYAGAAPAALPGIAAFLLQQQQPQRQVQGSYYEVHGQPQQQQRPQQRVSQPVAVPPSAAFAAYSPLHIASLHDRAAAQSAPMHRTSSSSPNLSAFKNIALDNAPPTRNSFSSSSSSSTGSVTTRAARTQTSYKPKPTTTSRLGASAASNNTNSKSSSSTQVAGPVRTSRYLREIDRRTILHRIENGEKQASLAKEYQVSRAAISNLKQRRNRNRDRLEEAQVAGGSGQGTDEQERDTDEDSDSVHQQQTNGFGVRDESNQIKFEEPRQSHRHGYRFSDDASSLDESYWSPASEQHAARSPSPYQHSPSPSVVFESLKSRDESQQYPQFDEGPMKEALERVTHLRSATMDVLFTRLVDRHGDECTRENALRRIARQLIEHALATSPTRAIDLPLASVARSTPEHAARQPSAPGSSDYSYYRGVEFAMPTCAITVSECGGAMLLREYQEVEPQCQVGHVALPSTRSGPSTAFETQLPSRIHESSVLLLVASLDAHSIQHVAHGIQTILRAGARQHHVCVITIYSDGRVLLRLLSEFPQVRVVTAETFSSTDPLSDHLTKLLRPTL